MRVPPLLLVACAVGMAHATTERPCDVEGVAVTRGSTKYVVGRPHQRGAIFAKCDAHGTVTCFEDAGLADAPAWAFPRVSCDARTIHARRRKLGVAINLDEDKWPNGLVFYRFNDKYPLADHERDMVRQAIKMYEATDLGVAFQECEPKSLCDNKYVDISQKEDACYSYVGFTGEGGGQIMNLGKSCFDEPGIAVHELGHALGLYHEHTHPQREVIVLTDSDLPVSASNYAKETDAILKPYDKGSIMHYGRSAGLCLPKDQYPLESFCDVEVTTNCVMPKKTHCNNTRNNEIGQRSTLSPGDLNTLKAIYGTNKPTLKPTTAPVPSSPAPSPEPTSSSPSSSPSPSATTDAPSSTTPKPSEDTPVPTTKAPEPPSMSPPPPTTTAPAPSSTTGPPTASPTPQPSTTAPAPSTTAPTPTTTAPTPSTTTVPTMTAPVPTTTTPSAPTATKAPSVTTLAPATTTTTPSASQTSPPSTPTKRPDTAGSEASSPAPTTKAPSRPVTSSPAAQTTTRPATQRPTSTQRPTPTKRPTPTTEAPYRPGNVIPEHNSPAWWEWWNQNKGNKKWADLPRPESNGKWWSAWPDNQQDVAGESDAKNPFQPWQPAKQQQQPKWPTGNNKPMKPPQPQPQPKPKTGYSFRGWWGR